MNMNERKRFVCAVCVLAASWAGAASAIEVKTGKWEVTVTMRNPMMQRPQVSTNVECIEEAEYDISKSLAAINTCEVFDRKSTATEESWSMRCEGGDGTPEMTGTGRFRSKGATADGAMTMTMLMNGQEFTMEHQWEGRHVGPCD